MDHKIANQPTAPLTEDHNSLPFYQSLMGRGLQFIAILLVYLIFVAGYSYQKKAQLMDQFNQIAQLQTTEQLLVEADLAVFDAITNMLILFQPTSREQVLKDVHVQFTRLTNLYTRLSEQFPDRASSFFSLVGSLANVVMKPDQQGYQQVRIELAQHKQQLRRLLDSNRATREQLIDRYHRNSNRTGLEILLMSLAGIVLLATLSSLFFGRLSKDIYRLLTQIGQIIRREKLSNLDHYRDDELGLLIQGVNSMSDALDLRDQQLAIERENRHYQDKSGAIEHLAAGLVHEIGNPIAAIAGMIDEIDQLRQQDPTSCRPPISDYIDYIGQYNVNLLKINQDLKNLAQPAQTDYRLIDINELIEQSCNLLNYDERWYDIDITLSLAPQLPALTLNSHRIKLLLNNILTNALEACQDTRQGKISITTELAGIQQLLITVKDNGTGMDNQQLAHALDAFYTTKEQHNGLGLFSCLSIVAAHGGRIQLSSRLGEVTEIKIFLPLALARGNV